MGPPLGRGDPSATADGIDDLRSENVLECELRDARVSRSRDRPKGSAATDGIRLARVVEQCVVEDVEVLGPELQAGFFKYREAANDGGVPHRLLRTAKSTLDHGAKAGSGAGIHGNREGGIVQPVDAGFAPRAIARIVGVAG